MAEAAEALEYERAGELRDVLRGLDQLEGRQAAIDPRGGSHDVIGFARQPAGGAVCGIVLRVREGRLVGRRIHYLANVGDDPDEAVLGALVKGYYLRQADDVPSELLVPGPFDEQDLVEEYLSGVADRRFRIRVPARGPKLELTRAANRNAAHVLERDRVERGNDSTDGSGTAGPPAAGARLAEALELQAPVRNIVCFDVSTLAGRESVGSCVWLRDGQPHKDEYRKFRIRDSEEGQTDDYAMMQEIVSRYFDRRVREGRTLPDLIVVDGGRGQLSAARQAMDGAGVSDLPTVALAKREEEVFRPGAPAPLRLPRTDPGLHWLQRARDEAHRFALHYNRTLRRRRALRSRLSEIPGVGPEREQRLLERFGSLDLIRRATPAQLARTPGIGQVTATSILAALREEDPAQGAAP